MLSKNCGTAFFEAQLMIFFGMSLTATATATATETETETETVRGVVSGQH